MAAPGHATARGGPAGESDTPPPSTATALAGPGAALALAGALLLLAATLLHPSGSDPNDPPAAFTEYAADAAWVWTHLGQLAGLAALGAALVALAANLEPGRPAAWGRIGVAGTAASVAVAAALQAVDGIALKVLVDRWASASGDARALAFEAAFAVRQVEVGLASLLSLSFGLTIWAFGLGLAHSARYPRWFAWLALVGGPSLLASGLAQAACGFCGPAMTLSMAASALLLAWAVAAAALLRQRAARASRRRLG